MKPRNPIYIGSPPALGDQSPLMRCHNCQRLNTQEDYRPDGECPNCQAPYKSNGSEED